MVLKFDRFSFSNNIPIYLANGYARSDGIVMLYLQRACDAKRNYATIVNVATCFNGFRDGNLLDLDLPGMLEFLSEFYSKCPVDPRSVPFIETYGSAQKVRILPNHLYIQKLLKTLL